MMTSNFVGEWRATSVDMSFAQGRVPPEKMEEAAQRAMAENAPAFDLNANGTARVLVKGNYRSGTWSVDRNIINVDCENSFIKLEVNGNKLTTLPDRAFTFEKRPPAPKGWFKRLLG